jgi:hypothetical protein
MTDFADDESRFADLDLRMDDEWATDLEVEQAAGETPPHSPPDTATENIRPDI